MLCCQFRKKQRKSPKNSPKSQYKNNAYCLMLARLDEFDNLTPLIITPESIDESELSFKKFYSSCSHSPPPPRRMNGGRTLVFPLNKNSRAPSPTNLFGRPESRLASFENTTKSCATIPEDDENVQSPSISEMRDVDLRSIDRTSISCVDTIALRNWNQIGLTKPMKTPDFELAVPQYSPPSPPSVHSSLSYSPTRVTKLWKIYPINSNSNVDAINNFNRQNYHSDMRSPSTDSSQSFSSPLEFSLGTCSPTDTSGSALDSLQSSSIVEGGFHYRIVTELDNIQYNCENSITGNVDQRVLLKIDEESELANELPEVVTSGTLDSIQSVFSSCATHAEPGTNSFVPKSVSQVFEMLNGT